MVDVLNNSAESLGRFVRRFFRTVINYIKFVWELFKNIPGAFSNFHTTVEQMQVVGITSIPVVFAASMATGAIMSWQLAYQFGDMIPMMFVGMAVGKSVMVELCPILTAMVLAGRIGASMCSELGTMAVTEQLDAYKVLGLSPFKFLLAPRLIATVIMLPVLTSVGISPYLVGIVFIVNMGIGMITPPVGSCLYVACNLANLKFEQLVKAIIPYIIVLALALLAITYIEPISLGLAGVL